MISQFKKTLACATLLVVATHSQAALYDVGLTVQKGFSLDSGSGVLDSSTGIIDLTWSTGGGLSDLLTYSGTVDVNAQTAFKSEVGCSGLCFFWSPSGPEAFGSYSESWSGSADTTGDILTIAAKSGLFSTKTTYTITVGDLQTTAVPVPAAAWLFGSALLGLSGIRSLRKTR